VRSGRLSGEPLAIRIRAWSSLSMNDQPGRSSNHELEGGLEVPTGTAQNIRWSRSCFGKGIHRFESRAEVHGELEPVNHAFLSFFWGAPGEPSTVKRAPGISRF
jgi:hypothetical protein